MNGRSSACSTWMSTNMSRSTQLVDEGCRVLVMIDPVERDVPGDAHDARGLERDEVVVGNVVAHDRDALEAIAAARDGVEEAAVVEPVAGVGADEQRVARAVRLHHLRELRGSAELLPGGRVVRVGVVRKARGIEHVDVTVHLGLTENF